MVIGIPLFRGDGRGENNFLYLSLISLFARRREHGEGVQPGCVQLPQEVIHNRTGGEERRGRRGLRSSPSNLGSEFHRRFDKILAYRTKTEAESCA